MGNKSVKRILYATDLSENARVAGDYALKLSRDCDAHLAVVSVVSDSVEEMSGDAGYDLSVHYDKEILETYRDKTIEQRRAALAERVAELRRTMQGESCEESRFPTIFVNVGDPVEQIVRAAQSDKADLIVVGARGHSLLENILIGSVAHGVVKKSRVPVVTVPLGEG